MFSSEKILTNAPRQRPQAKIKEEKISQSYTQSTPGLTHAYKIHITIQSKKKIHRLPVRVDRFGKGPIPILITGHSRVYAPILAAAFQKHDLLDKYTLYSPHLYWCQGSSLTATLPEAVLRSFTLKTLVNHLEQTRHQLSQQGLLSATNGKIILYGHSGFSALCYYYSASYNNQIISLECEGPVTSFDEKWGTEKALFFKGNASQRRLSALKKTTLQASESAVTEANMKKFDAFREGYHTMNPTLWYAYRVDHRHEVWKSTKLNMPMMHHYFYTLLTGYRCQDILPYIRCPIHLSLGAYDTAVPLYLYTDSNRNGGIGFLNPRGKGKPSHHRELDIFTRSGHWSSLEEPNLFSKKFDNFIMKHVPHQIKIESACPMEP